MQKRFLIMLLVAVVLACNKDNDVTPEPDPSLVYFLVAENDHYHGDSFILPLKNPADIAMARELIENGEKKIVMAEITKNKSDNYSMNKDLYQNRQWSWHISDFLGFADTSIEIYDGWPTYVEENYTDWVKNTKSQNGKGVIGFWSYSVVREVDKEELY